MARRARQRAVRSGVRHVEVQVVADGFGTVWAVGVSDCSIRQRNQPVIVESACTPLDETGEQALRDAAIRLCSAVGYRGTGSAEFLIDPATRQFLFTDFRIQSLSGHLVTELTTGLDLAKLQLDIARGGQLSGSPAPARGHAIEVCLAAEDPEPSPRRQAAWPHCGRHLAPGSASTSASGRAMRSPPGPAR